MGLLLSLIHIWSAARPITVSISQAASRSPSGSAENAEKERSGPVSYTHLIAHGFEAIPAISESVAMTSNGGIITSVAGPGRAGTLELFYIFQMWAGRLEFMTLFALIVEVVASLVPRPRPKERS